MRVAAPMFVTRIRTSSRKARQRMVVRSSAPPRVPFANARLRPTRLAATLLDSLSALAHRRSRRSYPPSLRTRMVPPLGGTVHRSSAHLFHSLDDGNAPPTRASTHRLQKGRKRCPQRAYYGDRGRSPSPFSSSAWGLHRHRRSAPSRAAEEFEPFDRIACASRLSCSRPDLHDVLLARRRRRCSRNGPCHHATPPARA
jgi:hypothetical protein